MNSFSDHSSLLRVLSIPKHKLKWCSQVGFCVKSKCASFILLWILPVMLAYQLFNITTAFKFRDTYGIPIVVTVCISITAPMAGLLTDLKYTRYKTVLCSSVFLLVEVAVLLMAVTVFVCYFIIATPDFPSWNVKYYLLILEVPFTGFMLVTVLIFLINSIRFGMDQLHDSPTEDFLLFIHWYVWVYYLGVLISDFGFDLSKYKTDKLVTLFGGILSQLMCIVILILLTLSLCMMKFKSRYFYIEPPGVNPYKMVYRITKFASQHNVPLRRSAFTYCEEKLPSRLDLGKQKYGGPFTTKQVEDVKAFWGILKVFALIGPVYALQFSAQSILPLFAMHNSIYKIDSNGTLGRHVYIEGFARNLFFSNGLLTPLLIVICIPLYLCTIRPRILYLIPGSLKRVGLGIVLTIVSLVVSLAMDVAVHVVEKDTECMFSGFTQSKNFTIHVSSNTTVMPLYQSAYFFVFQHCLAALTNMLVDIAVLEFILSQSPYSMKGLLLGYFFSSKSFFQAIGIVSIFPFGYAWKFTVLSCGSGFYIMTITIGILYLILFAFVARSYKYRTVSEPSNEYRYAEEYYSNIQ